MNPSLARRILNIIPSLTSARKKGDNGRVAVVGGSFEFTGAPYYSAIAALKIGADMAHIFCSKTASHSIKAYSPEVIVHPLFTLSDEMERRVEDEELENMWQEWLNKVAQWEGAISSWIIGPGLGRDRHLQGFFPLFIRKFRHNSLLVFDADGLYYLSHHPQLFDQLKNHRVILTPNHRELSLVLKSQEITIPFQLIDSNVHAEKVEIHKDVLYDLPFRMLVKGSNDMYLNNTECMEIMAEGGYKRCGGIGDILAGAIGACAGWDVHYGPVLASWVVKKATRMAFQKQGRSLTAPSILSYIQPSFLQVQKQLRRISANSP